MMGTIDKDTRYPMRVTTRMTGLTADTIRKWEQRYAAVVPSRTEGNTRMFSAADIRKLNLLREVTGRGHHIKDVANLPIERLEVLAQENAGAPSGRVGLESDDSYSGLREEYLNAVRSFDVHRAQHLLARSAVMLRPVDFIEYVARPLLAYIGEAWSTNDATVAHEHLISAQLHGLLCNMLSWNSPAPGAPKVVVTTPEGHLHEFGAMIGAILATNRGFDAIYLGPNLPEKDILGTVELSRACLVILSVARDITSEETRKLTGTLDRLSDRVETWVGLPEAHALFSLDTGARYFTRYEDLDMALTQMNICKLS